jgi:hypothetical protein
VSITASDANAAEPGNPGAFAVSRTGSTASSLTVTFAVSGSATTGADYTALGTSVTIPAGGASAPINVTVIDDAEVEGPETVNITLTSGSEYTLGSPNSAVVTIMNDDSGCTPVAFVTGQVPGSLTNSYNAWVGMRILIGANPLTVSELGRWSVTGNSGVHTLKLVNATTLVDVPNGSVAISMSGAAPGQYRYGTLAAQVTLAANTSYFLVSQEVGGGDRWSWHDTTVTTAAVAQCQSGVYELNGNWGTLGAANHTFGPVNFKYCAAPAPQSNAMTAITARTYADWLAAYPGMSGSLSNATADADRDGLCNLVEYAFGTDPLQRSVSPHVSLIDGKLALGFQRNVAATDIILTVQASDDPAGPWTDLARSVNGGAINGLLDGVTVLEPNGGPDTGYTVSDHLLMAAAGPRRFMRLSVMR